MIEKLRTLSAARYMYLVGGYVRDTLLGIPSDDIDIVVTNLSFTELRDALKPIADKMTSDTVGGVNAVIKAVIDGHEVDFALARTESSTGNRHKDFRIDVGATLKEDLRRRDLTINAMAMTFDGTLIDPFNGRADLLNKVARAVSAETFSDDPLRVVRAARFIARYDLTSDSNLESLCATLSPDSLPRERISKEIVKVFKQARRPSAFFNFLERVGWLGVIAPELQALRGVPQDEIHHPEGDVLNHTLATIDAARCGDTLTRITMLGHDLGKVSTTVLNKHGRWSAPRHDIASVPIAARLYERLGLVSEVGDKTLKQALLLIELHMLHSVPAIGDKKLKQRVRRLHNIGLTFDDLARVCTADKSGRPPLPTGEPSSITQMRERVKAFSASDEFTPIVTGRDLIAVGLTPGPAFKTILHKAQDLQDAGQLTRDNWTRVLGL